MMVKANQYAQRIISTPGKQDGLAWQNADGTWAGPVGEGIARVLEQGYSKKVNHFTVLLQSAERPGAGCAHGRDGFRGQWSDDQRVCPRRSAGAISGYRSKDIHGRA